MAVHNSYPDGCNFSSSYYNTIAAFLTDLNPLNNSAGNITYMSLPDAFIVRYREISPFFYPGYIGPETNITFSFTIMLRPNGK